MPRRRKPRAERATRQRAMRTSYTALQLFTKDYIKGRNERGERFEKRRKVFKEALETAFKLLPENERAAYEAHAARLNADDAPAVAVLQEHLPLTAAAAHAAEWRKTHRKDKKGIDSRAALAFNRLPPEQKAEFESVAAQNRARVRTAQRSRREARAAAGLEVHHTPRAAPKRGRRSGGDSGGATAGNAATAGDAALSERYDELVHELGRLCGTTDRFYEEEEAVIAFESLAPAAQRGYLERAQREVDVARAAAAAAREHHRGRWFDAGAACESRAAAAGGGAQRAAAQLTASRAAALMFPRAIDERRAPQLDEAVYEFARHVAFYASTAPLDELAANLADVLLALPTVPAFAHDVEALKRQLAGSLVMGPAVPDGVHWVLSPIACARFASERAADPAEAFAAVLPGGVPHAGAAAAQRDGGGAGGDAAGSDDANSDDDGGGGDGGGDDGGAHAAARRAGPSQLEAAVARHAAVMFVDEPKKPKKEAVAALMELLKKESAPPEGADSKAAVGCALDRVAEKERGRSTWKLIGAGAAARGARGAPGEAAAAAAGGGSLVPAAGGPDADAAGAGQPAATAADEARYVELAREYAELHGLAAEFSAARATAVFRAKAPAAAAALLAAAERDVAALAAALAAPAAAAPGGSGALAPPMRKGAAPAAAAAAAVAVGAERHMALAGARRPAAAPAVPSRPAKKPRNAPADGAPGSSTGARAAPAAAAGVKRGFGAAFQPAAAAARTSRLAKAGAAPPHAAEGKPRCPMCHEEPDSDDEEFEEPLVPVTCSTCPAKLRVCPQCKSSGTGTFTCPDCQRRAKGKEPAAAAPAAKRS